jgi:phenylacetate-CoA ligase
MKIIENTDLTIYNKVIKNLRYLISTAELCSVSRSKQIEKHFNIRHLNFYGCVEGLLTIPCRCGKFHIPEIIHAEVADDKLKNFSQDGRGRFVFTNLAKKTTPIVRYLLDDDVTITDESKQKKSQHTCTEKFKYSILPHGRFELGVFTPNGRFGVRHFEDILFRHSLFADYSVTLYDRKHYRNNLNKFSHGIRVTAELYETKKYSKRSKSKQKFEKLKNKIKKQMESAFGLPVILKFVQMGEVVNFNEIRKGKPLWRLQDKRKISTQRLPSYL